MQKQVERMEASIFGNWIFIPDRPIEREEDDLLWRKETIHEKLEQIAERVVKPLYLSSPNMPLSFPIQ